MNTTDPIADMLTRIRNANNAGKEMVTVPHSNLKQEILRVLKQEGYIADFRVEKEGHFKILKVQLKILGKERAIRGLRRVSKPGVRRYTQAAEIPRVLGGLGVAILSTSKGVMTDSEAKKAGIGGEVLCYVW